MGTSRFFREQGPRVRVVAVEPAESLHGLEGLKHMATAVVPEIYDPRGHDEVVPVDTENGYAGCREVLDSDGLLVGHSSGAALWAARELAGKLETGVIVVLLPDGGERYLDAAAP
jgi:cysteine synthase B